jgi:ARG and Rhodanese-Phosphatase-superfamily-associated Protein domain
MHKSSFQFTDPIQHENLKIQFLVGPSGLPEYLTLAEGCRLNTVEILETGKVGQLAVHNRSPKRPLFIQLGELLKGGLQDRTVATDLVLDPGEIYDNLSVYCVEQARWSKRQAEDHKKFTSTQDFVATKPLRSSLERRENQRTIWEAVASTKDRIGRQLPGYLESNVSPSSLQLSLEDSALQKTIQQSFRAISGQVDTKTIGAAITINNRLERIEWYGHTRLFRRLWPGLLRAAILEALLERDRPGKPRPLDQARFNDLLCRLEKLKPRLQRPSPQTLDERWQFPSCRVTRTTYLRAGTMAHTSVSF